MLFFGISLIMKEKSNASALDTWLNHTPPLMVVYKTSNNMTLEKIYNKWLSIQPLSEADQNKLSMRFTVEYNYKCVIAAEPSLMYNRIANGTSYPCLENETSKL